MRGLVAWQALASTAIRALLRAFPAARQDPSPGVVPEDAIAELRDVLDSIGDSCPECPPDCA
jgi:hypothetical protein